MSFVVAMDGPAGVGKGTIAKRVADDLGLITIDTGATYRCVTVAILEKGIKLDEIDKITELLKQIKIEMVLEDEETKVYLDGKNVTTRIREDDVNQFVSSVSTIKEVREEMVNLQRKLAKGKNVIMEGRDIGTVVFPDATVKIFLDASLEERAWRRYNQNQETGIDKELSYEEVYESIKTRDYNDRNKPIGALKQAEDAILVDTTGRDIEENIKEVEEIINSKIHE
ncbi:MAG: (d)CMP kinase [Clostridia bacterium]|nr:(d)CMP kinase [Clostridia bacterium]